MLRRLIGCFTLFLVAATYPLWFYPPTPENPQIPWFSWGTKIPFACDIVMMFTFGSAVIGLFAEATRIRILQRSSMLYVISFLGLILLDQHRLQPWGLQFLLVAATLTVSQNQIGLKCVRWIALSIYFYSAVSKFDSSFYASHGQLLLDGFFKALSIDGAMFSQDVRKLLAISFPMGELLVFVLLLFRSSRNYGVILSWIMHLAIVLSVGPLGLNHEYGVLIWNVYFVMQNYVLFWSNEKESGFEPPHLATSEKLGNRFAVALTTIFAILPLLENWGWYDHWPAWAVYSSRPEKVAMSVSQDAADEFPDWLQQLCGPPVLFEEWVPVSLDRWAFDQRNCPVYPQARYRLALAKALLEDETSSEQIHIRIESTPDRHSGKRDVVELSSWSAVNDYLNDSYFFNTNARQVSK